MSIINDIAKTILKPELEEIKIQNSIEKNNLTEKLAELELALEDLSWTKILYGEGEHEFSREALGKISYLSRLMYLKNPLINRGVNVKRYYVWGQGVTIKSKDPEIDKVLQQFLSDRKNQQELTGHAAQMTKELDLECDGNIFLVFFVDKLKTGKVKVRSIPFSQIAEIVTNPDDAKEPWYYYRVWTDSAGKSHEVYYPDWCYTPTSQIYKGKKVEINAPVMHIKDGGFSDWKFGVSRVYSALDWAKAYKEFLEDWATITRAYARFAWSATTKGGAKGIAAVKNKFNTTWSETSSENNPPPTVGSMAISSDGASLTPIKTAGATTSPEDGRRILLMVCAAVGLPETFMGDASVGSLATAQSLDRPTELAMKDRQTFWKDNLNDILNYVLLWAVKTGTLKNKATLIKTDNGIEQLKWNEGDYQDIVEINFPPIIASDRVADVNAVVQAITLGGQISSGMINDDDALRMLLTALGEQNVEQMLDHVKEKDSELSKTMEAFLEKYIRKTK
jgi:hypothetical protein